MEETQKKTSSNLILKGAQVSYYIFCKRRLWLFSHNIEMEHSSDLVLVGKLLHESSYARKFKEIEFEGIKIDLVLKFLIFGSCYIIFII